MTREQKSLEARTDITELEEMLTLLARKSLNATYGIPAEPGWPKQELQPIITQYITLLQKCEEKTPTKKNDKSYSYFCVVTNFHGYNPTEATPEQDPTETYKRLHDLETLGLTDGKRFSISITTTQSVFENGEIAVPMSNKTKETTARSYIATEKGKKLLQNHRAARNAYP